MREKYHFDKQDQYIIIISQYQNNTKRAELEIYKRIQLAQGIISGVA